MIKTDTLKKNYEFKYILSKGKYYKGSYIDIYIKRGDLKQNKIGIAVSVKVAKAVKRNRIKRLIRENYRLLEKEIYTGNQIVFVWKKKVPIEYATFFNIQADMRRIFIDAKIMKGKY